MFAPLKTVSCSGGALTHLCKVVTPENSNMTADLKYFYDIGALGGVMVRPYVCGNCRLPVSIVTGRALDSSFVFSGVLDRIGGLVAQSAWLDDNQARVD
jgi:hypothetical protein